jgi:hypothetical protein
MVRLLIGCFVVCALVAPAGLLADEVKGTVKSVDAKKSTITLTVDGKDRTLDCSKECKVTSMVASRIPLSRRTTMQTMTGVGSVPTGQMVTCVTERKGGTETCTEVRVEGTQTAGRPLANVGSRLGNINLGGRIGNLLPNR